MATTRSTSAPRTMRTTALELMRRADAWAVRAEKWWKVQTPRVRVGAAVAAIFAAAAMLNIVGAGFGRLTATPTAAQSAAPRTAGSAPSLVSEGAPADAGKTWSVVKIWQGAGARDTEMFTVRDHWRVDWLYSPSQANDVLRVFIFGADGSLLQVAGITQTAGPGTSFWVGPGTYFMRVMSTGGDWKLDVQELH